MVGEESKADSDIFGSNGGVMTNTNEGMQIDVINVEYGLNIGGNKKNYKKILHGISFKLVPGQLCALMGPSGCGKSTLLDLISDRRFEGEWSGDILFNNGPRSQWFNRDSAYILQDDLHIPTLTVRETVWFSASVRLPEGTSPDTINKRVDDLLDIMGLTHVKDSIVGDATHKGISGGQMKRLSIAVEIVSMPYVIFLDEPTSGLDSTIAWDVMSAVRKLADRNRTIITTIHQPSPQVFGLFDTVALICLGRLVYFGPASEVVEYFSKPELNYFCPPGKNHAEFIIEITEGVIYPKGMVVPLDPTVLVVAYEHSRHKYTRTETAKAKYAVLAEKDEALRNVPFYERERLHATTKLTQFKLLMWRNGLSIIRDKQALAAVFFKAVVVGLLIGTVFYNQGHTTTPLFSPVGMPYAEVTNISALIFFGMMHAMVTNIEAIPFLCARNLIFRREIASFAYSVSPYWLAHCLCIIPMLFIGFLIFCLITFFMCGFRRDTEYFFYYVGGTFMANLCSYYLAMLIGSVATKESTALVTFPLIFLFFSTFSGYPILLDNVPVFWSWAPTINFVRWCYEGLMVNQWKYYDDQPDAGGSVLELYSFTDYNKNVSFAILGGTLLIIVGLVYLSMRPATKKLKKLNRNEAADATMNPLFQSESGIQQKLLPKANFMDYNLSLTSTASTSRHADRNKDLITRGYKLTFKNIYYTVPAKKPLPDGSKNLTILRGVSGVAEPGEVLALMGSSGAGKTTLLDILAERKTVGEITGDIFINGRPKTAAMRRSTAYVMQDNVHIESLSVKETLTYAALLRLPQKTKDKQREKRVSDIMELLGLSPIAESLVGGEGTRGISGGQKKRLSIGVEIIHLPEIIFLDEPTTGLDSAIAYEVMSTIRGLANHNRCIITTIHQPSPQTYGLFDKLLLLAQGRLLYLGPAADAASYFMKSSFGFFHEQGSNPADYVIAVASGSINSKNGEKIDSIALEKEFKENELYEHVQTTILEAEQRLSIADNSSPQEEESEFVNNTFYQVKVLTQRLIVKKSRERLRLGLSIGKYIIIALFYGSIYYQLGGGTDPNAYINRSSICFFSLLTCVLTHQADIPDIIEDRALFNRERASKVYSTFSYFCSWYVVNIPLNSVLVFIYSVILYYMVGLHSPAENFFFFFLICWIVDMIAQFIAQFVASCAPSNEVAMSLFPVMMFFALAFEGFIIYLPQYPDWLEWATYVSYLRYAYQALILNEFQDNSNLPLGPAYIDELGFNTWNKTECALMLWLHLFGHAIAAFLVLKYINFEER